MRHCALLLLLAAVAAGAPAQVSTREIEYTAGGVTLRGFLAEPESLREKRPGILVVHEWWGHNEYARTRARMLAELGYVALAVDMYGDGKTAAHPSEAGEFAAAAMEDFPRARATFEAALNVLRKSATVDPRRLAAVGYCFGGGVVLQMARAGVDLRSVVSFHGSLRTATPAVRGGVRAKVLVCNGGDDGFVPQEDITALKKEMRAAEVEFTFRSYPGARHGFTNPAADSLGARFGLDLAYNAQADRRSWSDMQQFLKRTLGR
jgi:dienelactone hydrolase